MSALRVGGVPEHFNYPWKLAKSRGLFDGVNVEFVQQKLGTGAMIAALKNGELDVVVALTEGLVSDIANGSDLRLLGTYVKSPLCWAISTGRDSGIERVSQLRGKTFGVSRMTSGSHLMALVLAMERGWHPQNDLSFKIMGDFKNLRDGVNDGSTDAFMWETFTTKPFHDSGEVHRVGDITTPWPCFMIAALESTVDGRLSEIRSMMAGIRSACEEFHGDPNMPETIAAEFGLKLEDAQAWYDGVEIVGSNQVLVGALERAAMALYQAKVLASPDVDPRKFVDERVATCIRDIKSMRLYNKPELVRAIYNHLKAAGLNGDGPLDYESLLPFDQHHYHGTDSLDSCVELLGLGKGSRVVNIGSGFGGPARYFAGKYGMHVLGVELQDDIHRAAAELTSRCGLQENVHHIGGDFMVVSQHMRRSSYDAVVSWLTVLHIPQRVKLFKSCFEILKPGGYFFADDFIQLSEMTPDELDKLANDVFCPYVPDKETYMQHLCDAGFEVVSVEDLTKSWRECTRARVLKMDAEREELVRIHREDTFRRLRFFYKLIQDLFAGGRLGGARIIARKPAEGFL